MNRHERRAAKKRKSSHPECKMVCEETDSEQGVDLFIVFDGVKIARRGYPAQDIPARFILCARSYSRGSDDCRRQAEDR